ncbi:MAG: hypothetical protein Q9208_002364 [Pyrenodesmia sp. 3 TL-2023]
MPFLEQTTSGLSENKPTLGRYLSIIHDGKYKNGKPPANRQFRFKQNPVLSEESDNVILSYRGSFNPPHRGHLAVLWHAYYQLAESLNIVAAVVLLRSDESVQGKCSARNKNEVICFEDRARLWKQDPNFPPWAWVSEDSKSASFSSIAQRLKKLARKDDCKIRLAELLGPDCCGPDLAESYFHEMTIVSDAGREAIYDRLDGLERFQQSGFTSWLDAGNCGEAQTRGEMEEEQRRLQRQRAITAGEDRARKAVQGNYNSLLAPSVDLSYGASDLAVAKVDGLLALDQQGQPPTAVKPRKESFATQLARLGEKTRASVSINLQLGEGPTRTLHFLRTTPEQHAPFRGISSTLVQQKMHELQGYKLKEALDSMALSPNLLWDILLPPKLQRERSDPGEGNNGCTMQCAPSQKIVLPWAHQSQPALHRCGNRTLDNLFLPGGETKVRRDPAPRNGLGKRKRASSIDGEAGGAEDRDGGVRKKRRMLCYTCFYKEIVEFYLQPRESREFAIEDWNDGKGLGMMAVSP